MKPQPVFLRRKRGAVLGLAAVVVLILVVLGFGFFFLAKIFGGGRELANATDSGAVNIAKQALKDPSRAPAAFGNQDIMTNFAPYLEGQPVSLLNYNRLLAHAIIVALNAKSENTPQSAANAKRVWSALNEIASYLRAKLEDPNYMERHFNELARANNLRMLGNYGINANDYAVAYLKHGGCTNVQIDSGVLNAAGGAQVLPIATSGFSGKQYIAGYSPFTITMNGESLTFCGIPLSPGDRPHLISLSEFKRLESDNFAVSFGNYPSETLPPNTFKSSGLSREGKSQQMMSATACAIVGCLSEQLDMRMRYGVIEVRNGPSAPGPRGPMAKQGEDVFCHGLSGPGIDITGTNSDDYFCHGSDTTAKGLEIRPGASDREIYMTMIQANHATMDLLNQVQRMGGMAEEHFYERMGAAWADERLWTGNYINQWCAYNEIADANVKEMLWRMNIPNRQRSLDSIRHRDGSRLGSEEELKTIRKMTVKNLYWDNYNKPGGERYDPDALPMLDAIKKGYDQYGETDSGSNMNPGGFTTVEQFKCDVMSSRVNATNCAEVPAPSTKSGVKWFDHKDKFPAPSKPYNFGVAKSAYDYLVMIDQHDSGSGSLVDDVLKKMTRRCQEIEPSTSDSEVAALLKSKVLPLGTTLYFYSSGSKMTASTSPPPWYVATTADGGANAQGKPYDVIGNIVNCSSEPPNGPVKKMSDNPPLDPFTDGLFPGWCWRSSPKATCTDSAIWTPSSGYNMLLGALEFQNTCSGGGSFCQPN